MAVNKSGLRRRKSIIKRRAAKRRTLVAPKKGAKSVSSAEPVRKIFNGQVKQVKIIDVKKIAQKELNKDKKGGDGGSGVASFGLVVQADELAREANTWAHKQRKKEQREAEKKLPKKIIAIERKVNPDLVEKYKEVLDNQEGGTGKPTATTHLNPHMSLRRAVVQSQFPDLFPYVYNQR